MEVFCMQKLQKIVAIGQNIETNRKKDAHILQFLIGHKSRDFGKNSLYVFVFLIYSFMTKSFSMDKLNQ